MQDHPMFQMTKVVMLMRMMVQKKLDSTAWSHFTPRNPLSRTNQEMVELNGIFILQLAMHFPFEFRNSVGLLPSLTTLPTM